LTSQIPAFKMTIVGPLPSGSSGHDKSKNPVNGHDEALVKARKGASWVRT